MAVAILTEVVTGEPSDQSHQQRAPVLWSLTSRMGDYLGSKTAESCRLPTALRNSFSANPGLQACRRVTPSPHTSTRFVWSAVFNR